MYNIIDETSGRKDYIGIELWKVQRTPTEQAVKVNLSGIRQSTGKLTCAFLLQNKE